MHGLLLVQLRVTFGEAGGTQGHACMKPRGGAPCEAVTAPTTDRHGWHGPRASLQVMNLRRLMTLIFADTRLMVTFPFLRKLDRATVAAEVLTLALKSYQ